MNTLSFPISVGVRGDPPAPHQGSWHQYQLSNAHRRQLVREKPSDGTGGSMARCFSVHLAMGENPGTPVNIPNAFKID